MSQFDNTPGKHVLVLMRHGKSDWGSGAVTDFQRPLADRGKKAVPKVARWLANNGVQPDCIVSSPAVRARETTFAMLPYLDATENVVVLDERLYLADRATLLQVLAECAQNQTVLLVAHNPGLEELLQHLAIDDQCPEEAKKSFPTGMAAVLEIHCSWSELRQGSAKSCVTGRPKEL